MSLHTLRELLTEAGFDWDHPKSQIVYQHVAPGEFGYSSPPGWAGSTAAHPERITFDHPILDHEFSTGYGGPQMPRFIASDVTGIYFPGQYDGATWIEHIPIPGPHDLRPFTEDGHPTPYPGG